MLKTPTKATNQGAGHVKGTPQLVTMVVVVRVVVPTLGVGLQVPVGLPDVKMVTIEPLLLLSAPLDEAAVYIEDEPMVVNVDEPLADTDGVLVVGGSIVVLSELVTDDCAS